MNLTDIITSPWAIIPENFNQICAVLDTHLRGPKLNLKDMESRILSIDDIKPRSYTVDKGVAIIPLIGPISKTPDIFDRVIFGMVSSTQIKNDFQQALNDDQVKAIILLMDSPGGTVDGTQELSNFIFENRGKKPVIAFSDGMIASATYWIAAASDEILISGDTNPVGSIGVISRHIDESESDRMYGYKITEIVSGKYKNATSPSSPLSDENKAYIQDRVDYLFSVFINDIAKFRGISQEEAIAMSDGARIYNGKQAIDAGLVDGVSTMEILIAQYGNQQGGVPSGSNKIPAAHASNVASGAAPSRDLTGIFHDKEAAMTLTIESLAKDHAEIYAQVIALGRAEAEKELSAKLEDEKKLAYEAGISKGAETELERIKGVAEQAIPGHDALVKELMFDGKTTPADAAMRINKAEREKLTGHLQNMRADAPAPAPVAHPPQPEVTVDPNKPVEDRAKEKWDADAKIREEFGNNFNSYLAYMKASEAGQAKILKGGNQQ